MVRAGLLRTLAPSAAHCTQAPTIKELLAERAVKAALSRACEVDDDTQLSRTLFGGPLGASPLVDAVKPSSAGS